MGQDPGARQGHVAVHVGCGVLSRLLSPPAAGDGIAQYWRSGGTTGRPLFYPRSRRDIEVAMHGFARVYACAGAKPGQTVHCAFPLGIHPAGQMMTRAAEASGLGAPMARAGTTTPSALQIELIDKAKAHLLNR